MKWVPFPGRSVKIDGDALIYLKRRYRFWDSRPLVGRLVFGSFGEDARGRWYVNFQVEVPEMADPGAQEIGIDLGLKSLATVSTGEVVENLRHYRQYEAALGKAQRARNRQRVRAIHAKIANCRRHHHHEVSTRMVRASRRIVVGNVSASALAKTKMAKSVLDAGWSSFRNMLRYKAMRQGVEYVEVDEAFTTQACSCCGAISASSPKGKGALGMRVWVCSECGTSHDRDVNAARNILRLGAECRPPVAEIAA